MLSSTPRFSDDEPSSDQIKRLERLEKQIEKLESHNLEEKLIQKLEKQNKKLDEIESKLNQTKTTIQSNIEAYCVKCRQKRTIDNPKETTMKNGRPAVRGTCSSCGTKVFRIVKKK